jgi:acyl-CoA reductase-like NAD-dependent aldehyde dehydrogenase
MSETKPLLIGGAWRETRNTFEARAPFDGKLLARVSVASHGDVEDAIASAQSGAKRMRALPRFRISEGLRKIADAIKTRADEFARAIAVEAGKPIKAARAEVTRGIATFTFAAEEARRFAGEVIPTDALTANGVGRIAWTERIPRGVIFGITPFNFPLNLVAHKVAPALAAKNSIIIKPSPRTPLTALLLGEVFLESGLPKEALQIVQMDLNEIDFVLQDERVRMISFTGSAEVGWNLRARAARKAVTLELGGNAPLIVDETADIRKAARSAGAAAFNYAGQVCISAQRLIVHKEIVDRFTTELIAYAKTLKNGNPLDEQTEHSVMIDEAAARRVESWIEEAVRGGAKILCGGRRDGAFLEATVLTGVHNEMRVLTEELFAPVATIQTFSDFSEAVAEANNTRYGLQAGVFTRDLSRAIAAARALEYGGVIVNDSPNFRVDNMPYGGVKQSGFGREGVRYAMEEMSEPRVIVIKAE